MSCSVFIAHANENFGLALKIADFLSRIGVEGYIQSQIAKYGKEPLPERIKRAIRNSKFLIAILTQQGEKSSWVNQEIGYAIGVGVPVIPLKTAEAELKGFIRDYKYRDLNPSNPLPALVSILIDVRHELGINEAYGKCPRCLSIVSFELGTQEVLNEMVRKKYVYVKNCPTCNAMLQMTPDTFEISLRK